eukprot:CAMPEP_0197703426 /NCGR_PEP_ID=MMETSP1338-20131121/125430_1 /TAXON_ID=43686 ORGANISM="Pelagodinium beii, Strain RCC1491" /NCGR_SAMPLE_ID=MMETSP1338 /ASSEMBLY_ACC=CAM_ASM_000754 /LENGTH=531 /DNA_ID=CAMNT_0043287321 /DNA_START=132 /DNA_END=1727 /DNA_ORIENTATION=+
MAIRSNALLAMALKMRLCMLICPVFASRPSVDGLWSLEMPAASLAELNRNTSKDPVKDETVHEDDNRQHLRYPRSREHHEKTKNLLEQLPEKLANLEKAAKMEIDDSKEFAAEISEADRGDLAVENLMNLWERTIQKDKTRQVKSAFEVLKHSEEEQAVKNVSKSEAKEVAADDKARDRDEDKDIIIRKEEEEIEDRDDGPEEIEDRNGKKEDHQDDDNEDAYQGDREDDDDEDDVVRKPGKGKKPVHKKVKHRDSKDEDETEEDSTDKDLDETEEDSTDKDKDQDDKEEIKDKDQDEKEEIKESKDEDKKKEIKDKEKSAKEEEEGEEEEYVLEDGEDEDAPRNEEEKGKKEEKKEEKEKKKEKKEAEALEKQEKHLEEIHFNCSSVGKSHGHSLAKLDYCCKKERKGCADEQALKEEKKKDEALNKENETQENEEEPQQTQAGAKVNPAVNVTANTTAPKAPPTGPEKPADDAELQADLQAALDLHDPDVEADPSLQANANPGQSKQQKAANDGKDFAKILDLPGTDTN